VSRKLQVKNLLMILKLLTFYLKMLWILLNWCYLRIQMWDRQLRIVCKKNGILTIILFLLSLVHQMWLIGAVKSCIELRKVLLENRKTRRWVLFLSVKLCQF